MATAKNKVSAGKSRFMRVPDQFTGGKRDVIPETAAPRSNLKKTGKTGALSKPQGDTKSEKPIKPRT